MHITCPNISFTTSLSFLHVRKNGELWVYQIYFSFEPCKFLVIIQSKSGESIMSYVSPWVNYLSEAWDYGCLLPLPSPFAAVVCVITLYVPAPTNLWGGKLHGNTKDGCVRDLSLHAAGTFRERGVSVLVKNTVLTTVICPSRALIGWPCNYTLFRCLTLIVRWTP